MVMDAALLSEPCAARSNAVALFGSGKPPAPRNAAARSARRRLQPSGNLSRRVRQQFLDALMLSGDPALAAERLGVSLLRLVTLRATDADFARKWHMAINFAWERVEHRLLAQLLDGSAAFDSKLALAAMARRDQAGPRVPARAVDSASVARLRAEIRSLAGPDAGKSASGD